MNPKVVRIQSDLDLTSLHEFVRSEILRASRECDENEEFPMHIYRKLHELGWLQAYVPQEFGGSGATGSDMICVSRAIAYGSSGVFSSALVTMLGIAPVLLYAKPALKRRLAEEFASRFSLWSYAMTEPDTGSHISHMRTRARKVPGGYVLNGRKCFITNAGVSSHLTVFARMEGSPDDKPAISCFYLPGDTPGLTRGKELKKMGQRDSNTGELYFDEVFVPDAHLLGTEGQGLRIAFHCLQRSKIMIGAAGVGLCDRAGDLAEEHLRNRMLYGKSLIELPAIQHQLARMHTEKTAAWLLTCHAMSTWDTGAFAVMEASMAKSFSAEKTVSFVNEALELFGGYGYCREFEIEKLYRDAKILEIYEGPTLVQEQLIFRELFGPSRELKESAERKAA